MALRQQCRCEGFYMFRQPTAVLVLLRSLTPQHTEQLVMTQHGFSVCGAAGRRTNPRPSEQFGCRTGTESADKRRLQAADVQELGDLVKVRGGFFFGTFWLRVSQRRLADPLRLLLFLSAAVPEEVKPKLVKGAKRYGRRSKPDAALTRDSEDSPPSRAEASDSSPTGIRKAKLRRATSLESVEVRQLVLF